MWICVQENVFLIIKQKVSTRRATLVAHLKSVPSSSSSREGANTERQVSHEAKEKVVEKKNAHPGKDSMSLNGVKVHHLVAIFEAHGILLGQLRAITARRKTAPAGHASQCAHIRPLVVHEQIKTVPEEGECSRPSKVRRYFARKKTEVSTFEGQRHTS